ncbi:host specificity factor TipJ family phage tail protein [Variovorax sp. Varisp41]|uniref:host specificity factor TipJ family phage tail protein n=1 Tax=Variovorax sp. Varisp41 TaxID=3243033 RepID=UPI0039B54635
MRISLYDQPFAAVAPKVFEVESLGRWLLDYYGPARTKTVHIYEGQPSEESEISHDVLAIVNARAFEYTVLESPGETATLIAIGQNLLVSVALTAVSRIFAPDPRMPSNVNRTSQSPNNQLGSRENQVRLLQRVEDIFGTVKAIPSLMMTTYTKYVGSRQVEYGYYCISRGYINVSDVKDGETFISSVTGSSAAVYWPFTSPNSGDAPKLLIGDPIIDNIVSVRRSVETDGFTLKAFNQIQLSAAARYKFIPGSAPGYGGNDVLEQKEKKPNFNAVAEVGQTITISPFDMSYTASQEAECVGADRKYIDLGVVPTMFVGVRPGDQVTFSGWFSPQNNGTFTVATKIDDHTITVTSGSQADETRTTPNLVTVVAIPDLSSFSGTRTIIEVKDGSVVLSGTVFAYELDITGNTFVNASVANGLSDWTDWITLRELDRTQVWINVIAPQGLYADAGGKSPVAVQFEIQIEQLDGSLNPTGNIETVISVIGGAVSDLLGETVERVTGWTGPARVRMRRTTPYLYDYPGTLIDEIKWADLYSVSPVNKAHFGNKTTIHTVTRATQRATSVRNRQLNCIATRLIPRWNSGTSSFSGSFDAEGRHVSGTIEGTSFIHDVIGAVCLDAKIGNRQLAELDMVQMSGQVDLAYAMNPAAPTFNFTLDSDNTSLEETIDMIANAGFCEAYRQNGKIRLSFDRAQNANVAIFTHRNKKPNAETFARTFANDADYDGVEFVYQDPDTLQAESIILPLDGNYTKLKKFEIPGIRNFAQAWLRANREYSKIRGQRITVKTTTTTDARALLPNSRIAIVDNTRFKSFDGEVVGQAGMVLTLSCDVEFTPAVNHSIVLMKRDGTVQSINVTEVVGEPNKVLLQSVPAEALVTQEGLDGIRTIFSIASDDTRAAQAYLVQELSPADDDYVDITAVNYSDNYYAADSQPIPPRDSVIN